MSRAAPADRRQRVRLAQRAIVAGAIGTASGVIVSLLGAEGAGMPLTLGSALLLGWGLHRFGRLGADPPGWSDSDAVPPR
jgi:hypothetical protein